MTTIASRGQLRMAYWRWAAITVPLILLLGFASGASVPAGAANAWYVTLVKPAATPPDWLFPVAWTLLYVMMGLAVAMILNARGAGGRGPAVTAFVFGFALALVWQPVFFGAHRIGVALAIIGVMLALGILTAVLFARVRRQAAWLMVPYLVWVSFAGVLTWRILQLNPQSDGVASGSHATQIL